MPSRLASRIAGTSVLTLALGTLGGLPLAGTAAGATLTSADCAPVVADAAPLAEVADTLTATEERQVAAVNELTVAELEDEHSDGTVWIDPCGKAFYVEPVQGEGDHADHEDREDREAAEGGPSAATAEATGAGPAGPLADTFALQSRPGAPHTIYLDFQGQTVTGTAWNQEYASGGAITVPPYGVDGSEAFSAAELTEVQEAWLVVAEDYAPFDVNVTTSDPGLDALRRSSYSDTTTGTHVIITAGGPVFDGCGCGGVAYLDIIDDINVDPYRYAWVFTDGSGEDGVGFAQAISHEVGHNVGLRHDGTSTKSYYTGSTPWAPIMGASYYHPVSQWSRGEYPSANNAEDDTAAITMVLGRVGDDHADTEAGATALTDGSASIRPGVISSRADVDAFTLTTASQTRVEARPTGYQPNLDLTLRIVNRTTGATVATVNPAAVDNGGIAADGLDATFVLPAGPRATYLITVDGTGNGDPAVAGRYSDYGSLGAYRLTTVSDAPGALTISGPSLYAGGPVGRTWAEVAGTPFTAGGGTAPYTWSALGLPPGATLDPATGALGGVIATEGSWTPRFAVTDARGATATASGTLYGLPATTTTVQPTAPPPPPPTVPSGPVTAPAPPPATWVSVSVPRGKIHRRYRARLRVTGGEGALAWRASRRLPPGLRLRTADAGRTVALAGAPREAGRWRVRLVGRDASGRLLTRTVTVVVRR